EVHGKRAPRRQRRKGLVQSLDQAGAVRQPRQRIVMRQETDAPVALLLLLRAAVQRDGRNPERQRRQQAKRDGGEQERVVDPIALLRLIHIGRDDGDRDLIDQNRDIGPRV